MMKDKPPSQESIEALKERLWAEEAQKLYDSAGALFDSDWHIVDKETGEPKMNKNGTFRRRPQKPIDHEYF